jgi:hypothetical protein
MFINPLTWIITAGQIFHCTSKAITFFESYEKPAAHLKNRTFVFFSLAYLAQEDFNQSVSGPDVFIPGREFLGARNFLG